MDVQNLKSLYIFLDEGGNFDFSDNGTNYFVLTSLCKLRPFHAFSDLCCLKYDLIESGVEIEYFHASEDRQHVRDEVFNIINNRFGDSVIDSLVVEKRKTHYKLQEIEQFYTKMFHYLIKYVIKRYIADVSVGNLIIYTDSIPVKKKKRAIEKGLKINLSSILPERYPYRILHHSSKSNFDLQLVDYCNWAIFRKWERSDERSYNLIKKYIESEFDIFNSGTTYYY